MEMKNSYDFVMLFDVEYGCPNGDPDAGNAPRVDPETGNGLVSAECLKRKIRNYVELVKGEEPGYNILIKMDRPLNAKYAEAYEKLSLDPKNKEEKNTNKKKACDFMCKNYFDVRAFGYPMNTGDCHCDIVTGPVQINIARTISPVTILELTITRQAKTTEKRAEAGGSEMGKKSIIPYGLYRVEGNISANHAEKSGMSEEDLDLIWEALINMFEYDHSSSRGKMCTRRLYVFKHNSKFNKIHSDKLFEKIKVEQKDKNKPPRKFSDYEVTVDENIPKDVELIQKY